MRHILARRSTRDERVGPPNVALAVSSLMGGIAFSMVLFVAWLQEPMYQVWLRLTYLSFGEVDITDTSSLNDDVVFFQRLSMLSDYMIMVNEYVASVAGLRLTVAAAACGLFIYLCGLEKIETWLAWLFSGIAVGALFIGIATVVDIVVIYGEFRSRMEEFAIGVDRFEGSSAANDELRDSLVRLNINHWRLFSALDATLAAGVAGLLGVLPASLALFRRSPPFLHGSKPRHSSRPVRSKRR